MARDHAPGQRFRLVLVAVFLLISVLAPVAHASHYGSFLHGRHRHAKHGISSAARSVADLNRRDTYSCDVDNPCSNGACCGASGYCGYGDTYCGTGCVSNCDATAQCGKDAATYNATCPLNVCCSQYGFCGTTEDFCDVATGCQSNCVLDPSPPAGAASVEVLSNKVIGYYESWMAQKECHKVAPSDLPLDALTHVNFAFAYIDPDSYQIVTMDSDTPSSLFTDATNLKSIKSDLKVFVSVGGWSFSDNKTATQPIYGDIAASATLRQKFANNVVHFLTQYGFDGLDIDWEYPGAGDRGGKAEDTENYVLLLKTLRETFDASGSTFGLTFTAPSSYWYLRWFDLPNMIKYADWINLMTYDLHGVWDASDPIGSIVQAHTNLTEIKLAADLFWRVNIPPAKIVMGFGFYGRSFTLSDTSCTTPGCPFKGASNPGPCSDTSGILTYYEIQAILEGTSSTKRSTITSIHDKTDAVNYFTFDDNQWVSYDDEITFGQKLDWANDVGLGGAMIWASDLDNDQYSAHAALTGKTIVSNPTLKAENKAISDPESLVEGLSSWNGQKCFKYDGDCVNLNDNKAMSDACGAGFTVVGWDDAGCGTSSCHCGKPVCCPTSSAPKDCKWRGDSTGESGISSDCNAQCYAGEINVAGIHSSYGGGFTNDGDTDKCGRGYKVFCCKDPEWNEITDGCAYAACGDDCPSGSTSLFTKYDNCWSKGQKYCCSSSYLTDCHWVGGSSGNDCANAVCADTEVAVDRASYGDSRSSCDWSREKVACCTITTPTVKPAICGSDMCTLFPGYCPSDDDDESADSWTKRDVSAVYTHKRSATSSIAKRGASKKYLITLGEIIVTAVAPAYPSIGSLYTGTNTDQVIRTGFKLAQTYCTTAGLSTFNVPSGTQPYGLSGKFGMETEHPLDRQVIKSFISAAASGILASGALSNLTPIPMAFWQTVWDLANAELGNYPPIGSSIGQAPDTPMGRVMECFGSKFYREPFIPTHKQLNGPKGRLMGLGTISDTKAIETLAKQAVKKDDADSVTDLLTAVRDGFALFEYLQDGTVTTKMNKVLQQVALQLSYVEKATGQAGLADWWWLWVDDYFKQVTVVGKVWGIEAVQAAMTPYTSAVLAGKNLVKYPEVVQALGYYRNRIPDLTMTLITSMKTPSS